MPEVGRPFTLKQMMKNQREQHILGSTILFLNTTVETKCVPELFIYSLFYFSLV